MRKGCASTPSQPDPSTNRVMSIIDTIKRLIKGSPEAEEATRRMIDALATEAIKTGSPDALVAVAAHWEPLLEGRALPAATEPKLLPESISITSANDMKPVVIRIMQNAYLGGVTQMTNGDIKKAMNRHVMGNGGWKDGDLADNDPAPGIQPLWWSTLSRALIEMRKEGDISNDAQAWRTYTLAPHHLPQLPGTAEPAQLGYAPEPAWEVVG